MNWDQLDLKPRIITALKKGRLRSAWEVLGLSGPDLQTQTGLCRKDVQLLQTAAAAAWRSQRCAAALPMSRLGLGGAARLSLGCPVLDSVLRGGLPVCGITELAGPSGAGKSQLAVQLSLVVQYPEEHGGLDSGAAYICTEDSFPIRRLQQLVKHQEQLRPQVPAHLVQKIRFTDNIHIQHTADLGALWTCVSRQLPVLLQQKRVRLVVLDSVAAVFRSSFSPEEAVERSRHLLAIAGTLHRLSHKYCAPVLCINQVTDAVDGSEAAGDLGLGKVRPALGLAWANQVMVRLMMSRCTGTVALGDQSSAPRRLEVVSAPHLPRDSCVCGVWKEGVRGTHL